MVDTRKKDKAPQSKKAKTASKRKTTGQTYSPTSATTIS